MACRMFQKAHKNLIFFIRGVLGVIRWPESACKDSPLYKSILEPKWIAFAIKTKEGMTRHDLRIRGSPTDEWGWRIFKRTVGGSREGSDKVNGAFASTKNKVNCHFMSTEIYSQVLSTLQAPPKKQKSTRIYIFFIRGASGVIRWPESACKDPPLYKSILELKWIAFAIEDIRGMPFASSKSKKMSTAPSLQRKKSQRHFRFK